MKKLFIVIFLTFLALPFSGGSYALSCAQPSPDDVLSAEENLQANKYVFIGEITSVDEQEFNSGGNHKHEITVTDWVKGEVNMSVELLSNSTWGAVYDLGFTALFIFDSEISTESDDFNNSKLQFNSPLCSDGNPNIIDTDSENYAEYASLIEEVRQIGSSGSEEAGDDGNNNTIIIVTAVTALVISAASVVYLKKDTA